MMVNFKGNVFISIIQPWSLIIIIALLSLYLMVLLPSLGWHCFECAIHHELDVREEHRSQQYIFTIDNQLIIKSDIIFNS